MTPPATLGVEQFAGEAEPFGIASGGPISSLLKTAHATALTLASVLCRPGSMFELSDVARDERWLERHRSGNNPTTFDE